ncbi:hypothetical protein BKI52_22455 [marine bacterium AO1-C]|nr:hypothetical protein BKI52_22455 [marine bacterium AO1-C]
MMFLKKALLISLLATLSHFGVAQTKVLGNIEISNQGLSLGVIFNTGEAPKAKEPSLSPVNFSGHSGQIKGFGIGLETSFFNVTSEEQTTLYTPRLSYQVFDTWLPIGAKLNVLYYTNFGKGSLTIRPELGVNLGVNNYLMYGYNLVATNANLVPTRHQVTFGFTFPKIR